MYLRWLEPLLGTVAMVDTRDIRQSHLPLKMFYLAAWQLAQQLVHQQVLRAAWMMAVSEPLLARHLEPQLSSIEDTQGALM